MYPLRPMTCNGIYVQGTLATFIINTIRAKGEPAGFSHPMMSITTQDGSSVVMPPTAMTLAPEGYFFLDWEVPMGLTAGLYIATWTSTLLDQSYEKSQMIQVIANPYGTTITQEVLTAKTESELMVGLYYMIKSTQEIPVENEMAKISSNGLKAKFTFKRWNIFCDRIRVYRNNEIITAGYTIDHEAGEVIFDDAISEFDTITADYNFQWFTGEEMATFLHLAVNEINLVPPGSGRALANAPQTWYPAIVYGAAINAYRRLIHDLSYQQPRIVYGVDPITGIGNFSDAVENFKYLKENYEGRFEKLAEYAKRSVWPTIGLIVASEFTMPGGRSRWFRYLYKG
jgi:hypothetical protein